MLGFGASIVGTFDIPLFSQNSGNLIFQFFKLIILPTCLLMVYEDLYQTDLSLFPPKKANKQWKQIKFFAFVLLGFLLIAKKKGFPLQMIENLSKWNKCRVTPP